MGHAARMTPASEYAITVNDYRRHRMALQWHAATGTWSACDTIPPLVHGVALIRATQPNICLYGQGGQLHLQIGTDPYTLSEHSPRIKCLRGTASFGFRRNFVVESAGGTPLWSHSYWTAQGTDFFVWLAARAQDPAWRATNAQRWSEGVEPSALRAS